MTNPHPDSTVQPPTPSGPATLVEDTDEDLDFELPLRTEREIGEAAEEFYHRVWYDRHQVLLDKRESGELDEPPEDIRREAEKAAERIESRYGADNLGPYDDFEWGMINGKLSALRWVLGFDWDMLDT
jgi:hypothetical protein